MDRPRPCGLPRNVYFELGYARGKGKVTIQLARRDTTLEFDVRNWRTSFYKNATELEEICLRALIAAYGAENSLTEGDLCPTTLPKNSSKL